MIAVQPIASTRHTIILLAILSALTIMTYTANSHRSPGTHQNRVLLYSSVAIGEWFLASYVFAGLRTITARDLIGTFRWFDVPLAVVFFVASQVVLTAVQRTLGTAQSRTSGLLPTTVPEKIAWLVVSLTAGIVEELVFRGYLQRQFAAWTHSTAAAIAIQAVIFGIAHSYQGVKPTINITVYAVLFGLLAHYRRGLVPGMLAHACTDIIGGFIPR